MDCRDHPIVNLLLVACKSKATGHVPTTHRSLKTSEISTCPSDVTGPNIPRSISLHHQLYTEKADQCQQQSVGPKRIYLLHRPNEEVIEHNDGTFACRSSQKLNDDGQGAEKLMLEYDQDGNPSKNASADERKVLSVVLDKFRAVVRRNGEMPEIACHLDFRRIPVSTTLPDMHSGSGHLWYTPVQFRYNIDASVATLPFIMFENGLIDVRRMAAIRKGRRDQARGYCEQRVCIALPLLGFGALCRKIKDDTGFEVDYNETFRLTQDCSYVTTVATINSNSAPHWVELRETSRGSNVFVPEDLGPLTRDITDQVNAVSIGLLGIAPSLTIELPLGTTAIPPDAHPRIRFRVAAIRAMLEALPSQAKYFTLEDRNETPANELKPASRDCKAPDAFFVPYTALP
jgi:hypothetical protein